MSIIFKFRLFQSVMRQMFKAYRYDGERFYKYALKVDFESYSANRLLGFIIAKYHVIEKGLTMPEMRLGFGQAVVESIIYTCNLYISKYGASNCQISHTIAVLTEYKLTHEQLNYALPINILNGIDKLVNISTCEVHQQKGISKKAYFVELNSYFDTFAKSRHSIRHFSEDEIKSEKLSNALSLAQSTTPTSCNRQSIRLHVVSNKELIEKLLNIQTGNRGFGHLTNKLIIISSEISVYNEIRERNLCFVDCGIYAMNLLYALHFNEIGACALNWSSSIDADKKLRSLLKLPDSEIVSLFIACGVPANEFKIAQSKRFDFNEITKYYE